MKWISVKKRLPKEYIHCLTIDQIGAIDISFLMGKSYYADGKTFFKDSNVNRVTHWMPLPKPPQRSRK